MTYYCKHNVVRGNRAFADATDTVQVTKNLHFEQLADICSVSMEEIKSLNPQYKKNIIPGESKAQTSVKSKRLRRRQIRTEYKRTGLQLKRKRVQRHL